MPRRAGMSKAQSIDTVLPASFIESRSSHRLSAFSTNVARLPPMRSPILLAGINFASQKSIAMRLGYSWNVVANTTQMIAAAAIHLVPTLQVTH